jgi:hypothetical protein
LEAAAHEVAAAEKPDRGVDMPTRSRKGTGKQRYGTAASRKVKAAMHERKTGKLRSGRSGKKVKSRKQAIAIGLSEARRAGAKVPRKRRSSSR